ncbi:MAG: ribosome biogenesis GTP-binding protein YihA/YsxC [Rhodocyclaceae bacterium]|jgi:GTP-binding protein
MFMLRGARFELSVARSQELPPSTLPEVAFAGRSNAGKSSAINVLADHNRLAFVSKTPGRTQLINFFRCGDSGYLVDLPGYGYAQVPEAVRRQWQGLLENYLTRRSALVGLVLIMDARHPLTPLDHQMLEWFAPSGRPVHVLLTKSDKLSRGEGLQTLARVRLALSDYGMQATVQLFSSLKKTGVPEAEQAISAWMEEAHPTGEPQSA